jgi:multicomponent Na+:H+ antiporter subunit D
MQLRDLLPVPVALPLAAAAFLAALPKRVPRWISEAAALGVTLAIAWLGGALACRAGRLVYWFGGWTPREGLAPGIAFVSDTAAGALVCVTASLCAISILFGWSHFHAPAYRHQALLLVFLAGASGFALSGDLFTLFVCFELMGVASYALAAIHLEEPSLEGAFHFAITNSAGAILMLWGIALLYAKTGALNMALVGARLGEIGADPAVAIAFALLATGLLVKAAVFPFHFWLPDVHAVAASPISLLFSGIMVELGLCGLARIHAVVLAAAAPPAVGWALLAMGALSALIGGFMGLLQRHLKRLLAFSTVSHAGILLMALSRPGPAALAGVGLYLLGHAVSKGALFLCAGILQSRCENQDILALRGRGRRMPWVASLFGIAALALIGLPPFPIARGHEWMEAGNAFAPGWSWIPLAAACLTGWAILKAGGRIFLGWGSDGKDGADGQGPVRKEGSAMRVPSKAEDMWMPVPVTVLLAMGIALGISPGIRAGALRGAETFLDADGYGSAVLRGETAAFAESDEPHASVSSRIAAMAVIAMAVAGAGWALRRSHRPGARKRWERRTAWARAFQSGNVRTYLAWMAGGFSALALAVALGVG